VLGIESPAGDLYAKSQLNPQRKKEETFEALLRQLVALTRQQPVLMIYEDAHWIDPSSSELLDRVVDRVASLPMLLLITFRPEFQPRNAAAEFGVALLITASVPVSRVSVGVGMY